MGRKTNMKNARIEAGNALTHNYDMGRINSRTYYSLLKKINNFKKIDAVRRVIEDQKQVRKFFKDEKKLNRIPKKFTTKDIKKTKDYTTGFGNLFYIRNIDTVGVFIKDAYTILKPKNTIEDLYDNIKYGVEDFQKRHPGTSVNWIGVLYDATDDNKVVINTIEHTGIKKGRTIGLSYLDSLDDFIAHIGKLYEGGTSMISTVGSDAINNDGEFTLNTSKFYLTTAGNPRGEGKSDKIIYKCVGIETKLRDCGYLSLKECGFDYDGNKMSLGDFDNLRKVIVENDLKISIMLNSFTLKKCLHNTIADEQIDIPYTTPSGRETILKGCALNLDIVKPAYLHKRDDADYTIIYDEFNRHYDVLLNNKIELVSDLYISKENLIIKNKTLLFTAKQMNINLQYKPEVEKRFVIFDYETVIDFDRSSCMREYSLSILNLTNDQLERLTEADMKKDIETIKEIRKACCMTFLGYDCSEKFIEWILANQENKAFCFIGFNNANFDNFILLNALLVYQHKHGQDAIGITDIFYNGSQLLNFRINGRHDTFDIHKHLMGSLKANCDSFKIQSCSKLSFDHEKAQQLYEDDKLIDFITGNEELKEYNEHDVLATGVLFCKYRQALKEIPATREYSFQLDSIKTVGSLIYKVFEASKKTKKFDLPKLSFKQYTDMQNSKIAGRVELFNGVQKVEERLVSTDVCSLYPYVMSVLDCYYPCGNKLIEVDEYKGDDVIGFYYCDIDQSNLKGMNLPNIYAKKSEIENDWGYNGILENYLISNVMVGLLLKYNCKVVVKSGFIFPDKKKSCDMFDFILDFMSAKNEQDTKKKNKDDTYNPALRETLKLLMNSLSGKVIEGLHTEKTEDISTLAELEKIKDKCEKINVINSIGGKLFITYEVDAETLCKKAQRPIYLGGVLIYDYAKRYMFENSYSKVGLDQLLYTDTDASKFRYSRFIEWKNWVDTNNIQVRHWPEVELKDPRYKDHRIYDSNSKVFGSFEDELEEMKGDNYIFYCLEKKSWLYAVDNKAKFRFKGLNDNAQILTLEEDFINRKISNKGKPNEAMKINITKGAERAVHKFYNNNKANAIGNGNEVKFFEQIYKTGEAYLLCNSFRKIVKNSLRNVEVGQDDRYNVLMNSIQVNYMIKHIKPKIKI